MNEEQQKIAEAIKLLTNVSIKEIDKARMTHITKTGNIPTTIHLPLDIQVFGMKLRMVSFSKNMVTSDPTGREYQHPVFLPME